MFPHTVTIYNRDKDEHYHRTVIEGVIWNSSKGAVVRKTGVSSADELQLIIPLASDKEKAYLKPREWEKLTDKTGHWTLQPKDIVILGEIEYEVVKSGSELSKLYDDVLTINNIDTRKFGSDMDHWEVSGK
ncbi:hypothetical protein [Anaerovorax sp. IOR16]|uniref:hypothetical protein n=1 Tax=Anaerovorax sp. IOR16 TaxID=2773458 RepID=UPI0019D24DFA|nr:hypothetical protein [Anaerovorax sp. IOR16]